MRLAGLGWAGLDRVGSGRGGDDAFKGTTPSKREGLLFPCDRETEGQRKVLKGEECLEDGIMHRFFMWVWSILVGKGSHYRLYLPRPFQKCSLARFVPYTSFPYACITSAPFLELYLQQYPNSEVLFPSFPNALTATSPFPGHLKEWDSAIPK